MPEPDPGPGAEVRQRTRSSPPCSPTTFWLRRTRLIFDRTTTRRELEIIGTDLHCDADRIVTDPALAIGPWLSGKQSTPVMPLNEACLVSRA